MLPRRSPPAAIVPSGPPPKVISWLYVCPVESLSDHWIAVEAGCVVEDVLCSVTFTTRKIFPALGWSNCEPVFVFTELSVTVQSLSTITGAPTPPVGVVDELDELEDVVTVLATLVATVLIAVPAERSTSVLTPMQPKMRTASTPSTIHSQVRDFFCGGGPYDGG